MADPEKAGVLSDRQLLERFIARRDEAAFEVLVWRHGPMVLGVCRRLLAQEHDAEDAFQATFLALVRKASSIRKREALGSWLHKVAYRIAVRARAAAARRAGQEKQRLAGAVAEPESEVVWQDLRPVLDAEVGRLPECYRTPVILCYLQGKTTEEAAQQIGCPRGTVLSRLARARERLRCRLVRRGIALSTLLLSATLAEKAGPAAVPTGLAEATIKTAFLATTGAAAGAVAAPIASLTEGVLKSMMLSQLKIGAAVVLAAGLLVTGAGTLTHRALADKEAASQKDNAPEPKAPAVKSAKLSDKRPALKQEETHPITVRGTAVNAQGQPVKDATIYLLSTNVVDRVLGSTTTDTEGRYVFQEAKLPITRSASQGAVPYGTLQVYGTAPGYGFAWHGMRFFQARLRPADWNPAGEDMHLFVDDPINMKLVFEPAAKLHGRIQDEAGKPLSQVKVRLLHADYFDVAGKEEQMNFREFWGIRLVPDKLTLALTDNDGRFQLAGLPPEVCFWVCVEHSDYAPLSLYAVTTDRQVTERDYSRREKQVVHSGELKLVLAKPRRVLVQAIYEDTGKPASGVRIGTGGSGASAVGYSAYGTTDAGGKLALRLPPGDYPLTCDPPADSTYVRTTQALSVSKTPDEQPYEVRIEAGCILILEAIDATTGKGLPNVAFGYQPDQQPGSWFQVQSMTGIVNNPLSDSKGRLRAVVRPGKRKYTVTWSRLPEGYEVVPEHDDVTGEQPGTREVDLPAGKTVTVRFKLQKK
jgi:RNA polymerase sigma factor (sigma-70 family)